MCHRGILRPRCRGLLDVLQRNIAARADEQMSRVEKKEGPCRGPPAGAHNWVRYLSSPTKASGTELEISGTRGRIDQPPRRNKVHEPFSWTQRAPALASVKIPLDRECCCLRVSYLGVFQRRGGRKGRASWTPSTTSWQRQALYPRGSGSAMKIFIACIREVWYPKRSRRTRISMF